MRIVNEFKWTRADLIRNLNPFSVPLDLQSNGKEYEDL